MKRISAVFLALMMVFSVMWGAVAAAPADGAYEAEGKGNNGPIKVKVTFAQGKIAAVEVLGHKETAGLSDGAFERIPMNIVETGSLLVDSVSGATNSSKGIVEAVKAAIVLAGGDPADFEKVAESKKPGEVISLEADLVVVGAGGSGIPAALRADELGVKTILLEKTSQIGGTLVVSGGNQVVLGSKLQKEAGVSDDSVQSMVDDFMKNGANLNDPDLLKMFAENVGATTDWLNAYVGIQYDMAGGLHKLAEYSFNRELAYQGGGAGYGEQARKRMAESGVDLRLNTRATELKLDGDKRVVGVMAQDLDGNTYDITAKAVILATGGYGANKDLLSDALKSSLYYGRSTSTGDGLIMARAVDAATRLLEYGKRYPNGVEVAPGLAKSTIAGNIPAFAQSAILINKLGSRVVNEKASNRTILEAEVQQPDSMLYLLMDKATFDIFKTKLGPAGISEADIEKWLAVNGKETPQFMTAATLDELAALSGVDAAALKATVERYNGFVKAGKDEDFGRGADFLKVEIGEGPYYLIEQKPRFATTMGGLIINTQMQVLNTANEAVPGLYAAGEVTGGVMGDDSPSGANNAWAVTSGKLAAESAVKQIKAE